MSAKKLFLIFILILVVAAGQATAQDIPRIDQDFVQWTQVTIDGNHRPGSDAYKHPNPLFQEGPKFQAAVEAFLDEDWALADDLAGDVRYEVVAFHDTGDVSGMGDVFYGLIPQANNGDGRGFYFLRPRADVQRRLVIQAPHAIEDERTGVLGSEMFRASGARALMLTGADRCASETLSNCSGSTDCGLHTVADGAHAVDSFFYIFGQLAGREHADTHVLQLHGFKADGSEPEFSISDGTHTNRDSEYISNKFSQNLVARMDDVVATLPRRGNSCNSGEIGQTDFQCGRESVQGRDLNGSADACDDNATTATGRFLHLELSNDLRDPDGIYSQQLVINTVNAIFPRTAEVFGFLWADGNGNGNEDDGELGVPGVKVEVLDTNDNVIGSTTTRAGNYRIGNLDAGTYRLRVQIPAGYTNGSGLGPDGRGTSTFNLPAGESFAAVNALVPSAVGQIGDRVWLDANGDGLLGSESGVGGIIVELLDGDTALGAAMTDAQGFYSIPGVPPGNYRLRVDPRGVVNPASRGFTVQGTGVTDGDSEISPATGKSPVFQVDSSIPDDTRDVGLLGPCYDVDLVANGFWKWWTPGVSDTVPSNWNGTSFPGESSWQEGFSPLGYDVGSRAVTEITRPDAINGRYTTYFRHSFEAPDPRLFQGGLQLTLTHSGGVVIYLNGSEILRRSLPWGANVDASIPASTDSDTVETVSIPAGLLLSGSNLLAVELHQYEDDDENEWDLSPGLFDLRLSGRVCGSCRVKEVVLTSTNATFIEPSSGTNNNGNRNFGTEHLLELDGGGTSAESVLLGWNLSSIPQGADVLQAEIVLFIASSMDSDTKDAYAIHELLRPWNEVNSTTGATWNHAIRPASDLTRWQVAGATGAGDSSLVRLGMMPVGDVYNVSAEAPLNAAGRSVVEKWINNPATNFGFLIDAETGSTDGLEFHSDDNPSGNAPRLRVIYLAPTCQP